MSLVLREHAGASFVEGTPGQPILERVTDVATLLEACFEHGTRRLLLYPENLTPHFFDLSSREAGEILQKLRNYHVHLAIVRTPELQLSTRFGELLADEEREPYFRLFDERAAAVEWLGVE